MEQSPEADELAAALYAGIGLITRRLRQAASPSELSLPERSALARLDRGGPATAAGLARIEQISPQAMGITLGALQERGLVERSPDPTDGRRVLLSLTEAGREVLRIKRTAHARKLAAALQEEFSPAELAVLADAAPLIQRLAERI